MVLVFVFLIHVFGFLILVFVFLILVFVFLVIVIAMFFVVLVFFVLLMALFLMFTLLVIRLAMVSVVFVVFVVSVFLFLSRPPRGALNAFYSIPPQSLRNFQSFVSPLEVLRAFQLLFSSVAKETFSPKGSPLSLFPTLSLFLSFLSPLFICTERKNWLWGCSFASFLRFSRK